MALRTQVRQEELSDWYEEWDTGCCGVVSECLYGLLGLRQDGGCWVEGDKHYAHVWNLLPDGRIFDLTSDQFGYSPWVITNAADKRYNAACGCGKDG